LSQKERFFVYQEYFISFIVTMTIYKRIIVGCAALTALIGGLTFAVTQQKLGTAFIAADTLPSDGCQHSAMIGKKKYAFDAASYALIQKAYEKVPYGKTIRQKIWYSETGNTGTVQCGRGSSQQYPEIHIDFFVPKK
jgi:hypothetical protein